MAPLLLFAWCNFTQNAHYQAHTTRSRRVVRVRCKLVRELQARTRQYRRRKATNKRQIHSALSKKISSLILSLNCPSSARCLSVCAKFNLLIEA
jgi:hypothetical protein